MTDAPDRPARVNPREINATIRYAMWSVFAVKDSIDAGTVDAGGSGVDRDAMVAEVQDLLADLGAKDLVVRGFYDVAGLRADAD
ncbi:MAG TPA: hypothetical protein VFX52_00270, partial [Nocardioidaceae bacterium]|nr:hypothetical protein [Nocardioidaceae bacterium]